MFSLTLFSRLRVLPLWLAALVLTHALPAASPAVYQCPMHPWIKSAAPGKCTICGMDLVAITAAEASLPAGTVTLPHSSITAIGLRTAVVERQPLTRTLRVAGRIEDDDTRHRILSARVPGRVEKLFINFVGAPVEAGEPLATLWSPELLTAERVFVERLRAGSIAFSASEQSAAREQLQLLGLSEADIAALEKSREPSAITTVRAPSAGIVVSKSVYEGQYVQSSDRLFELADFSRMWFVFDAYAQDLPWLKIGQRVEITTRAVPGETISAPIEFIDPNFDEARQTTRVRAILPNPHYGTAGQPHRLPHRVLAEGRVLVETPAVLAAPRSAVLDNGGGPVAYVATSEGRFEQRKLKLGRRGDALVEVLAGLDAGDSVVTEGNLLIDAQAQLAHEAGGTPASDRSVGDTAHESREASPTPASVSPAPAASTDLDTNLRTLANIAVDAADALSSDDFARYEKLFPSIVAASQPFSFPALQKGTDLKSARASFEPWSTAVADFFRPQRAQLGLRIFQCPMSPVLQKGRWVQRSAPLKNPFFGSAMPDCGEELR
jgi:Cu(I)/Ag(I) efflux system membrane fusion protein